jgi:hypothetical protein
MDLVEKINDDRTLNNERNNYILRLETTSAYINEALSKQKTPFFNKQDRSKLNYSRVGRNNV